MTVSYFYIYTIHVYTCILCKNDNFSHLIYLCKQRKYVSSCLFPFYTHTSLGRRHRKRAYIILPLQYIWSLRYEVKMSSVAWGTRLYTRPEADKRLRSPYTHTPIVFRPGGKNTSTMPIRLTINYILFHFFTLTFLVSTKNGYRDFYHLKRVSKKKRKIKKSYFLYKKTYTISGRQFRSISFRPTQ